MTAETPEPTSLFDPHASVPARFRTLVGRLRTRLTDLGPRVASSLILIVAALATLQFGSIVCVVVWLSAALRIHMEWQRLIGGDTPRRRLAIGSLAIVVAAFLAAGSH